MRYAPALFALFATTALGPDAEACSYSFTPPFLVAFGLDGAPQGAQVLLEGTPGSNLFQAELRRQPPGLETPSGEPIGVTRTIYPMPGLGLLAVLEPERALGIDEPVAVWVEDNSFGQRAVEVGAFVGGSAAAPPAPPAPTRLTWYHDRLDAFVLDSCGPFREVARIEVQPVADPNLRWLRVTFSNAAGETYDVALRPVGDQPVGGDVFLANPAEVTCVTVRAVGVDGAESAPLESCRPDRCVTSPGGMAAFPYRAPDWGAVPDGCDLACAPNAEDGYDCVEGANPMGGGLDADAGGCSCRATPAAPGVGALAGLGLLAARRRRRRR